MATNRDQFFHGTIDILPNNPPAPAPNSIWSASIGLENRPVFCTVDQACSGFTTETLKGVGGSVNAMSPMELHSQDGDYGAIPSCVHPAVLHIPVESVRLNSPYSRPHFFA